jgi:DNA-binding MarR family transcriptional regulator
MSAYLSNLLGAVSLAAADRISAAAQAAAGMEGQAPGALVLLGMAPRMTIKRLAERLGLSHAGAVRLAQRLEEAQLAKREASDDQREVRLLLTRKGAASVERINAARATALDKAVSALASSQRAALEPILAALMARLTEDETAAYSNCRLCDVETCRARGCPLEAWERSPRAGGPSP